MCTGRDSCSASLIASLAFVAFLLAAPALAQDCPELVGSLGVPAYDVAVSGGYAYVADDDGGVRVIDVSDPYHPIEVGLVGTNDGALGVAVSVSYAYVATVRGLRVIDVSDPTAPVEVGSVLDSFGNSRDVAVSGDYAYVVNAKYGGQPPYGGLHVIDVSEPSAPVEVGYLYGPGYGVAVLGGHAYVANRYGGLRVIDVQTPSAPVEVGYLYGPGDGVAVSGGYAYVAGDPLRVIDVSEPSAPFEVSFLDMPTPAWDVAVSGGYAYVAVGDWDSGGLYVIDVSTPSAPVEAGYREAGQGEYLLGVAVSGGHVFLANEGGLFVFRECGLLFTDSFESGDTSAWSATVP